MPNMDIGAYLDLVDEMVREKGVPTLISGDLPPIPDNYEGVLRWAIAPNGIFLIDDEEEVIAAWQVAAPAPHHN